MNWKFKCEKCGRNETEIVEMECVLPVRGKKIAINSKVRVCKECGNDIFDEALDGNTLKKAYSKYRELYESF